jgi:hypothetical protein
MASLEPGWAALWGGGGARQVSRVMFTFVSAIISLRKSIKNAELNEDFKWDGKKLGKSAKEKVICRRNYFPTPGTQLPEPPIAANHARPRPPSPIPPFLAS